MPCSPLMVPPRLYTNSNKALCLQSLPDHPGCFCSCFFYTYMQFHRLHVHSKLHENYIAFPILSLHELSAGSSALGTTVSSSIVYPAIFTASATRRRIFHSSAFCCASSAKIHLLHHIASAIHLLLPSHSSLYPYCCHQPQN